MQDWSGLESKPIHLRSSAPRTSGNWYTISQFLHPSGRIALKFSFYIDHREFLSRIKLTVHHHNFLDNSLFVRFHLLSFFSYRFIDLYFINMGVFACMCTICVELVPVEARRGHQKPWTWNYRRLWATMWVLGTKSGFSVRADSVLSHYAICLISILLLTFSVCSSDFWDCRSYILVSISGGTEIKKQSSPGLN